MNGIRLTLRVLHHGERHLAEELLTVADRHSTEHEVHHVAKDLAGWSREHVERLAVTGRAYGLELDESPAQPSPGLLTLMRQKAAQAVGHRPEPGLLLLRDLRDLHLDAAENSLSWEMLAQVAQASKDTRLLELASSCHPQTLRQMRWTNTMIKNISPQLLTSL
ncbi:hypothetical protein GLX30_33565 [Streptomyces sp. Tu 2975]|uniref:hypothetical protein n=1 Tax=Streptomyces sp. Tu 2975 TaxID=2676871 RepID=UPI00135B4ACB|nr:hypothetical protein [Streptomyces sp. Tu 2975]QIP88133.1 hypothetical protein GLX30_33565 [Streptomyces sp. Tu 2975]